MSKNATRLYNQFKPDHYDIELSLNKQNLTFEGKVTLKGTKIGRPSKRIILHQKGLTVSSATVIFHPKNEPAEEITISRIVHHKSYDEVRLHFDQLIRSGMFEIILEFRGNITKEMTGIYPSRFTHKDREEVIIATQFESHHARKAFPCIDEPEAKATFKLTLNSEVDETVLSNTPIKNQVTSGNKCRTVFETTPKMSTYLLAFVTGKLHGVSAKTKDGIAVNSWSAISRPKHELEYANSEAVKLLEFYSDYFGVSYPLPKCDQVALPDFDAGAMENWGLITYREIALLTDPNNRSVSNEQYVSLVVAHELSHQWFGNLVTMKWWDDLWLNESFASLMEHIALDHLHPEWKQWELYTSSDVINTTNRDIYKDIQPVGVKVTDPDLIETLFDPGIVYAKGGRLLKMLRDFIGEEAFRDGLNKYFQKHSYKNTSREDLWDALSDASGQNISALMTPWITQPGMPIVEVDQNDNNLTVSQERYLLDGKDELSLWPVPLLSDKPLSKNILMKRRESINIQDSANVIINHHASGHYFTHYSNKEHRTYIESALASQQLPPESRVNILNDVYMLARGGKASLVDALSMILPLSKEDRDSVWTLIGRIIATAHQLTESDDTTEETIKRLKVKLAKHQYEKLGWSNVPNEDVNTIQLRHTMIAFMLGGEDEATIQEALKQYKSQNDLHAIDAELRNSILGAVVRHGKDADREKLLSAYPQASPDLQADITSALSASKSPDFARSVINRALGKDGFVRDQDIMRWLALLLRNRHTRNVMWDFLVSEWEWVETSLGNSKSFDFLPVYAASAMNTASWQKKYVTLFEPKMSHKVLERNIRIGMADIEARLAWRKRDENPIKQYLQEKV